MKNEYKAITLLANKLNFYQKEIDEFIKMGKNQFIKNDFKINIGIGILNEVKEIILNIDENLFLLDKEIHDLTISISSYANNITNKYGFINCYKLYDALTVDLKNLTQFLSKVPFL